MELDRIDFLIVGAAKSATTWLQQSLQLDGFVYMPDPELHFFSRHYEAGVASYLRAFVPHGEARLIGEKSNSYLETAAAAERIAIHLAHANLIAQLRNPIERAYSDYCMLLRRGAVGRNIEDHLDPRIAGGNRFLQGGRYGLQLRRYFDHFPAERIHIALYEDMKSDPVCHLKRVRAFLGLRQLAEPPITRARVKNRAAPVLPLPLRRVLRPLKPLARPFRQSEPFEAVRSIVARKMQYPAMAPGLIARLADYYREDMEAVAFFLRREMVPWTDGEANDGEALAST